MKIPETSFLSAVRKLNNSKENFENFKKLFGKLLEKFYSSSREVVEKS